MSKYIINWKKVNEDKKVKVSKRDIIFLLAFLILAFIIAGTGTYPY